jgi:hypothetical protein
MDANDRAAFRTLPSVFLAPDESFKPKLSQALKILNHAHAVFGAVAFVQLPQSSAGELVALKTELLFSSPHIFAMPNSAYDTNLRLFGVIAIAARAALLLSEVADTKAAVHSARRDHLRADRLRVCRLSGFNGRSLHDRQFNTARI